MNVYEFILALIGIGFVVTVLVVVLLFFLIRKIVRWVRKGNTASVSEFTPLDQETATPDQICAALKGHVQKNTIGKRARNTMNQVKSASEKQAHLKSLISGKFAEESLTWTKFMSAIDTACHVVTRNCALLANRIQAFDVNDYRELQRQRSTAKLKGAYSPDETQLQRWELLDQRLQDIDDVLDTNEQLLLELDKFSAELSQESQASVEESANEMLDEIQVLTNQAKLYE